MTVQEGQWQKDTVPGQRNLLRKASQPLLEANLQEAAAASQSSQPELQVTAVGRDAVEDLSGGDWEGVTGDDSAEDSSIATSQPRHDPPISSCDSRIV